jgi:hypothetical protein
MLDPKEYWRCSISSSALNLLLLRSFLDEEQADNLAVAVVPRPSARNDRDARSNTVGVGGIPTDRRLGARRECPRASDGLIVFLALDREGGGSLTTFIGSQPLPPN